MEPSILIDRLNGRICRALASDLELVRITGQTVDEYDADTTAPDPREDDIAPDWPGFAVQPTTRCGYAFWCQLRSVNGARPYLWQWIENNSEPARGLRIYTVARWDSLLAMYEHERQEANARDEAQTQADVRAAAHW